MSSASLTSIFSASGSSTIVNTVSAAIKVFFVSWGIKAFCSSLNASYAAFAAKISSASSVAIFSPTGNSTMARVVAEAHTLLTVSDESIAFCSGVKASYISFAALMEVAVSSSTVSSILSATGISITATMVADTHTLSTIS